MKSKLYYGLRLLCVLTGILFSEFVYAQYDGNQSPTYTELVAELVKLDRLHEEIELYAMGDSDYGLPIYLCVINGSGDSVETFKKARNGTTILINNAIHAGEPDGINACLLWIDEWVKDGKQIKQLPLIAFIPAFNVGGMFKRSGTSRANQNGPEEYGFRGNAQNLDLNRDFVKMDSKNLFTFTRIYHALKPDVFVDTHVSNGADYQYTMTYIASIRQRMAPSLAALTHDELVPHLHQRCLKRGFDLIPYVNLKEDVPEKGIVAFDDLPRYAMGYTAAFHSISFTTETHMLKPFPQRVRSTLAFIDELIRWTGSNAEKIEKARIQAFAWEQKQESFHYKYQLQEHKDSILFKGYRHSYELSPITQSKRLKYHQDKAFEEYLPYYHSYKAMQQVSIPDFYVIGGQCTAVIERLKANQFNMVELKKDTLIQLQRFQIRGFESASKPYEGHFPHSSIQWVSDTVLVACKKGDMILASHQQGRLFLCNVLTPDAADSYFMWNFFDSFVQQKEYFSPYVFEDQAIQLLQDNKDLNRKFIDKKESDATFRNSPEEQLNFIYRNSPFFETGYNVLPYFGGNGNRFIPR